MTTFDNRERAFENKFARDEEMKFKALAMRNRRFGAWVGEKLGKTGDDLTAYENDVIKADLEEAGDADVLRKVRGDLDAAGVAMDDTELTAALDRFSGEVAAELGAE